MVVVSLVYVYVKTHQIVHFKQLYLIKVVKNFKNSMIPQYHYYNFLCSPSYFLNQMVNTKIRLIIFFETKDGEALHSQQRQEQYLIVAPIMTCLLQNSDLN